MPISQKRLIEVLEAGQKIEQNYLDLCRQITKTVVDFRNGTLAAKDFVTNIGLLVDQPGMPIAEWSKILAIEEIRVKVTRGRNERRKRKQQETEGATEAALQRQQVETLAGLQVHDNALVVRYTKSAEGASAALPVGNAEDDPEGDELDEQEIEKTETDDGAE